MDGRPLPIILACCCGIGFIGLSLMLGSIGPKLRSRQIGLALCGVSALVALSLLQDSLIGDITFALPAALLLASAVLTVGSRNPTRAALWFILTALLNSLLILIHCTPFAGMSNFIVAGGLIGVLNLITAVALRSSSMAVEPKKKYVIPACVLGAILTATLGAAVLSSTGSSNNSIASAVDSPHQDYGDISAQVASLVSKNAVSLILLAVLLLVSVAATTKIMRPQFHGATADPEAAH